MPNLPPTLTVQIEAIRHSCQSLSYWKQDRRIRRDLEALLDKLRQLQEALEKFGDCSCDASGPCEMHDALAPMEGLDD